MKSTLYLIIFFATTIILTACNKDEPINKEEQHNDEFLWCGRSYYYANLITANDNYDGEEVSLWCYRLNVPKEGGTFSFSLSKEARYISDGPSTPITQYDFIPWGIAEFYYNSENIPENWHYLLLNFHSGIGSIVNHFNNVDKAANISTDWYEFAAHPDKNSFTITIPKNILDRQRQFNLWFGPTYWDGVNSHISYSLVVIQEK